MISLIQGKISLKSPSGNDLSIAPDGSINVKNIQVAPPNTIPIEIWSKGNVGGQSNSDAKFIIPLNTILYLQWHSGGCAGSGSISATQIWYDPTGSITSSSYLHSNFYLNISSMSEAIIGTYAGNGTKAIIARRARIDSVTREMFIRWTGYLVYNTYTIIDEGSITTVTSTTITDSTKAWSVNDHVGKYIMIDGDRTPLYIISNTATQLMINFNPMLSINVPYKIVSFNA